MSTDWIHTSKIEVNDISEKLHKDFEHKLDMLYTEKRHSFERQMSSTVNSYNKKFLTLKNSLNNMTGRVQNNILCSNIKPDKPMAKSTFLKCCKRNHKQLFPIHQQ